MVIKRFVAGGIAALLAFSLAAYAVSESELEAAKRDVEYAKAKADIAEHQAREARAFAERTKIAPVIADAKGDPKNTDAKAADTKAVDTKAADAKSADAKGADKKVADTKSADAKKAQK